MNPTSAWRSATRPQYVSGPSAQYVAPTERQRQAQALAAAVAAHIAAGGRYEVLPTTPLLSVTRRVPDDLIEGEV